MPTAFDRKFRALARKLIRKFGVSTGKMTNVTYGAMDQSSGEVIATEGEQPIPMSPPLGYKQKDIDGTTIQSDDFRIIVAGPDWDDAFPSIQPKTNDFLAVNGITVKIIQPNPLYSGEQVAAYLMQCRKGQADNA